MRNPKGQLHDTDFFYVRVGCVEGGRWLGGWVEGRREACMTYSETCLFKESIGEAESENKIKSS